MFLDGDSTRAVVSGYEGEAEQGVKIDQVITYLTWLARHIVAIVRTQQRLSHLYSVLHLPCPALPSGHLRLDRLTR